MAGADLLVLVVATGLFGLAFAFLVVFIIALLMYFRKTQHVSDLEVLKRKWMKIARLQFAGQYSNVWMSGVPYMSGLQPAIDKVNKLLGKSYTKDDLKSGLPAVVYDRPEWEGVEKQLDELNGRLRTNMRGIPLGQCVGYSVIDIQSDVDFSIQKTRENKDGVFVVRTPGGKTVVIDSSKVEAMKKQIRSYGSHLHLFVFEKTYGFSIPFIYSNKSTELLVAYPDQFDVIGDAVVLRGAGLNSFAGILYLTGYPNREIAEVTAIVHASYANLVENVVGAGSELMNKASGMDTTSSKMLAANIASHPTPQKTEK